MREFDSHPRLQFSSAQKRTNGISDAVAYSAPQTKVTPLICASLSDAILLGGACTIVVAVYMMVVSYSPLPWWDTWEYIAAIAKGDNPLSPTWLWRQHNEHRLVLQKLFFVIDLKLFRARQTFLLSSIMVIQFLHLMLWGWSMRVLGGWKGPLWRAAVGLVAFCIFCPSAWLNYTMGFQVCYVLSPLFATASIVALLLYWTKLQNNTEKEGALKFLWLSILAGCCGTLSLANGNLIWPLLVLVGPLLRLRRSAVLSIALTGVLCISAYSYHYVRPAYHANPIVSLRDPVHFLEFVAVYFGCSWVGSSPFIAGVIGSLGLLVAAIVILRTVRSVRPSQAFTLQLVFTIVFCIATALLTAAGRLNFGVSMAFQNRYQTFALPFWCSLGLLLLAYVFSIRGQRYAAILVQMAVLAVLIRGAILLDRPLKEARAHGFGLNVAVTALQTGIYEPTLLAQVAEHTDKLIAGVDYLKKHQLSPFTGPDAAWLGSSLEKSFRMASPAECAGSLEYVIPRDLETPGLHIAGWSWDRKHREPPREIVASEEGVITGLAAVGHSNPGASSSDAEVTSSYSGFAGYVQQPHPGRVVKIYAILWDTSPVACYFDSIPNGQLLGR